MTRTHRALLVGLAALGVAAGAGGAARARLGGTLAVGLLGVPLPDAAALADAPEAASARALLALPLCRLVPQRVPVLAAMARETAPAAEEVVVVTPLSGARLPDGEPLGVRDIAASWRRLAGDEGSGVYLGLLAAVAGLDVALGAAMSHPETGLRLALAHPWPDLESSLCHPVFTPGRAGAARGLGLYAPGADGRLTATRGAPAGPPFPAALSFATVSARATARLLQRGELHAVLGEAGGGESGAMLFATYLVHRPGSLPEGVLAALAGVDLAPLVRTFVPGPAVPMPALLPPPMMAPPPPVAAPKRRAPTAAGARSFTLGYDTGVPEHRAVAERLQVLLHDLGYPLRVQGFDRAGLARARSSGTVEAALLSVLLPPVPAPALALVLALAGDSEHLARELPPLGAIGDPVARAARVRERALALQRTLPVVPLFARGLRARLSTLLIDAHRDAFGLLVLDDAWLSE